MVARRRLNAIRKSAILKKARQIFWEKGYDRATMKDIARACGFKPSNIYNYFRSKEQLLYEILKEETSRIVTLIKHLENDDTSNPIEQLHFIITNHVELALGSRRASGLLFDVEFRSLSLTHRKRVIALRDAYERILRKVIRRGIESGYFAKIDEKLACFMITSMIVRTRVWFSPKGKLFSGEIANFIFRFALKGLEAVEGQVNQERYCKVLGLENQDNGSFLNP